MIKMKIVSVPLCVVMLMACLLTPVSAVESDDRMIDFGDGFYVVQTITPYAMTRSGDTVYGNVTYRAYYLDTQIGSVTLYAAFDISGSSAVATAAVLQGTGMNGWTFIDGGTKCSGNKASGTAIFESGNTQKRCTLSISCMPDGTFY